jgi:GTP cyclohydrolase I
VNQHKIEKGVQLILDGLGVDRNDHNFTDTPERYAKALNEMFSSDDTEWATFHEEYTDFILLRGHRMYSLCPHHLFPVKFKVSLAYVPSGNVLGLSKLARLLQDCNDGPLLQEAFTKRAIEKVHAICDGVQGVACLVEGTHGCLEMRGVRSPADFVTYRMDGVFSTDRDLERRFFELARRRDG